MPSGGAGGSAEIECDEADCSTTVEFERLFGEGAVYYATDVAVNGQGDVAVAVTGIGGSIDFGAKQLAGSKQLERPDLDVDPYDNVLVAGTFEGELEKPFAALR